MTQPAPEKTPKQLLKEAAQDPTIAEVAHLLDTSESTVRRLIEKGELRVWSFSERGRKFVTVDSLRTFIRHKRIAGD